MKIIDLNKEERSNFDTALALGNFDGLHLGHQDLIKTMIIEGKKNNLQSSLLLFKNHTKSIIFTQGPKLITSIDQKIQLAEEMNIDNVFLIDFDESIMKLSGQEFLKEIIIDKLRGKLLVVGYDYKFGTKASCNSDDLKNFGQELGFKVLVKDPVLFNGEVISSSNIRKYLLEGNIGMANELLARPYSFVGRVINGSNRGHKLGFPTANTELLVDQVIPKTGVYITNTIYEGNRYRSLTNIGYNPTFGGDKLKIETYIRDFNDNIYDKNIEIEFIEYLREDMKFSSTEDLIDQMKKDLSILESKYWYLFFTMIIYMSKFPMALFIDSSTLDKALGGLRKMEV